MVMLLACLQNRSVHNRSGGFGKLHEQDKVQNLLLAIAAPAPHPTLSVSVAFCRSFKVVKIIFCSRKASSTPWDWYAAWASVHLNISFMFTVCGGRGWNSLLCCNSHWFHSVRLTQCHELPGGHQVPHIHRECPLNLWVYFTLSRSPNSLPSSSSRMWTCNKRLLCMIWCN